VTGRTLRAGIVGASGVGAEHALALQRLEIPIVGVAGFSLASAKRTAEKLHVDHAFLDAAALIESPEIDVVHVCAPDRLHEQITAAAIRAGKHVLCEKPLADAPDAALRLRDLIAQTDASVTVSYGYRYSRLMPQLAHAVDHDLGQVITVRASYLQRWRLASELHGWRSATPTGASRALVDVGVHLLDLIEQVTSDEFSDLTYLPAHKFGATADVGAVAIGTLAGGAAVSLTVSQASAANANALTIEIDGTTGSARWTLSDVEELTVVPVPAEVSHLSDSEAEENREGRFWRAPVDGIERLETLISLFYDQLGGAVARARTDALDLPTVSDAARHVRLLAGHIPSERTPTR
jgi:predicted dehydrogenase